MRFLCEGAGVQTVSTKDLASIPQIEDTRVFLIVTVVKVLLYMIQDYNGLRAWQ